MYLPTLPSVFCHYNFIIMFLPCALTYTLAFYYPQWLPSQHALPLPFFLPFPLLLQSFMQSVEVLQINSYSSHLYIILCSTFHILTGCAAHSKAQIYIFSH
jgi:hypothetical protein